MAVGTSFERTKKRGEYKMEVTNMKVDDLIPYANNPRINDMAVGKVATSIREFGFKVPMVVASDGTIVAGHTRLRAAQQLGLTEVPVVVAHDLSDKQIKAFRIADNKTAEFADWDIEALNKELDEIGDLFSGFDIEEQEMFKSVEEIDAAIDEYEEPKQEERFRCPECQHEATKKAFKI